jgi:hypothetical protein
MIGGLQSRIERIKRAGTFLKGLQTNGSCSAVMEAGAVVTFEGERNIAEQVGSGAEVSSVALRKHPLVIVEVHAK